MLKSVCPECDADVRFTSMPKVGQRLTCSTCYSVLTVIDQHPIELDWAFLKPFEASISNNRRPPPKRGV